MSRGTAWFVHGSVILVGGTGLVYGWMRYLLEPSDEFAVVNHPREPLLKDLHLLTAPLLVFACGVLWHTHVWARIRSSFARRRRTGILLAAFFLTMGVSGYMVQTTDDPGWRSVWIWTHGLSACLWLAGYLTHQLLPRDSVD